jgi:hypothetical protein
MNKAIPSLVASLSGMKSAMYPICESTMNVTTRIETRIRSFLSPIIDGGKALARFALTISFALGVGERNIL